MIIIAIHLQIRKLRLRVTSSEGHSYNEAGLGVELMFVRFLNTAKWPRRCATFRELKNGDIAVFCAGVEEKGIHRADGHEGLPECR